jgi:hypothetical protein
MTTIALNKLIPAKANVRRTGATCTGAQSCTARRAIRPCFGRKLIETGEAV